MDRRGFFKRMLAGAAALPVATDAALALIDRIKWELSPTTSIMVPAAFSDEPNWDEINRLTSEYFAPGVYDGIFRSNPIVEDFAFRELKEAEFFEAWEKSGAIYMPIRHEV